MKAKAKESSDDEVRSGNLPGRVLGVVKLKLTVFRWMLVFPGQLLV